MSSFDIEPLHDDHVDEVIAVINTAFGFDRSDDWYRWKHREGPWGASHGVVARDRRGIVGVRLLLPWRLAGPAGTLAAHRAVEAATAPRAQGKGIFSLVNRHLMEAKSSQGAGLIFSTPNERSRGGYLKLGWSWLTAVPHVWRPVLPRRRRGDRPLEDSDATAQLSPTTPADRIVTAWSPSSLAWRLDARSGHHYRSLADAQSRSGLVYRRLEGRRVVTLLPIIAWGEPQERHVLLNEAARREHAVLMLDTDEPGGARVSRTVGKRRGESLLAVWPTPSLPIDDWPVTDVRNWHVGFVDLENVL